MGVTYVPDRLAVWEMSVFFGKAIHSGGVVLTI